MNIIKLILSKKQNNEHSRSIIVYSTLVEHENYSEFKTKCSCSFCVDLTILERVRYFDPMVESVRLCVSLE